jgi:hypothetical protein
MNIEETIGAIQNQIEQVNQSLETLQKKIEDRTEISQIAERLALLEGNLRKVKGEQTSQRVMAALRANG